MKHLSLTDSSVLKGIAILMMLWHHAFLNATLFNDFVVAGHGLCYYLALLCKLCVAVFVFLSGYGLMTKYKDAEHISIGKFYRSRFVKLMMNYWFIWLIFVPLSLLWLGDRPLGWEYFGFPVKAGAVLEFLGILQWADWQAYPYNPVWWYYSCVIGLYLLFPVLRWLVRRSVSFTIILSVALYFLPGPFHVVRMYVPLFVAGMLYALGIDRKPSNSTPPQLDLGCPTCSHAAVTLRPWRHTGGIRRADTLRRGGCLSEFQYG